MIKITGELKKKPPMVVQFGTTNGNLLQINI